MTMIDRAQRAWAASGIRTPDLLARRRCCRGGVRERRLPHARVGRVGLNPDDVYTIRSRVLLVVAGHH
ncbi:hypothetical protein [Micromonospora echinaurantiaca]|uniref:hypothetical protein n=1 Tax=Micromonospora echinaurantiaca TaxID=47857 RepID=UPI003415BED2